MKKVSILVPVYNVENYISRCLDSLVNQTYKNIEIICVNDCSTDNSVHIIEDYIKKYNNIILINSQKRNKLFETRRIGMKAASGDYIGFCDSDDYYELYAFEYMVNRIQEKDYDLISICTVNNENNWKMPIIEEHEYLNGELYSSFMQYKDKYGMWALLIKKDIIDKALEYMNYIVYLSHAEDRLWTTIIYYNVKKSLHTSKSLYNYCKNIESVSMSNHKLETHFDRLKEYSIMLEEVKKHLLYYNIYDKYKEEYKYICKKHADIILNVFTRSFNKKYEIDLLNDYASNELKYGLLLYLYDQFYNSKTKNNKVVNKNTITENKWKVFIGINITNKYITLILFGIKITFKRRQTRPDQTRPDQKNNM